MKRMCSVRDRLRFALVVLILMGCLLPLHAAGNEAPLSAPLEQLRREAQQLEQQGQWARACELYEQILTHHRGLSDLRDHYLICFRNAQQVRRHRDTTYREQVLSLSLTRALDVYGEVLQKLQNSYVERDKVDLKLLFKRGLEELRLDLMDAAFCQDYLPAARAAAIQAFQAELQANWANRVVRRTLDAQSLARELALAAQHALGLKPALAILELACGACNALDEHTAYLTPGQLNEVYDSLRGQFVGVGIELMIEEQKLLVSQIIPGSPADAAGLKTGDRVESINNRPTANLAAETAAELLRGQAGSTVELSVLAGHDQRPRVVKLVRQAVHVPSVPEPRFLGDRMLGIGYIQLLGFQELTLQELDEAIMKLQAAGMKAIILDLRGNPGGLVDVAVQVVQRFLPEGIITYTQGQLRTYNRTYESHNPAALAVPLVLLIDGETASSAEMVAGAIKDNQRGRLVGQPTFGKGSMQRYWRLSTSAGLRITVAKFYSPRGQAYDGAGVTPHVFVERPLVEMSMDLEQDPQVRAALDVARQLLMGR